MADTFILVRLSKKFANRIFHEFHNDHPHKTANGGELLVTGGVASDDPTKESRPIVKAAPTFNVRDAIAKGVLEEVREPDAQPSPEPVDVEDVVNGIVKPGVGQSAAPSDAPGGGAANDAATSDDAARSAKNSGK